jgi:hypothetical protein
MSTDLKALAEKGLAAGLRNREFQLAQYAKTGTFDNAIIRLDAPTISIQLSRDRGTDYVEVARRSADRWYNVELIARVLDHKHQSEFASADEALNFLIAQLDRIEELFSPGQYDATATQLDALSRQIMHERYGRPV